MGLHLMKTSRVAFLLAVCAAPVASAAPFIGPYVPPTVRPPKAVPATQCMLAPYAAFAKPGDNELDTYVLSGHCNINVAPATKDPVVQKVKVRVESEWSPGLKRASEKMTVIHPDKSFSFYTWATCPSDPFIAGANVTCKDQGMGGDDFSLFLNKEDAPFARNRVSSAVVAPLTARVSSRAQAREMGVIKSVQVPAEGFVGQKISAKTLFTGGPGACPMEVDFGDGHVVSTVSSDQPTYDLMDHVYAKTGYYTVKARSLPGCYGEATSAKISVKGASLEAATMASVDKPGKVSSIAVTGRQGACKLAIDFGDGKKESFDAMFAATPSKTTIEHIYWSPGRKNVTVTGDAGCTGTVTAAVDVPVARIEKLTRMGKLDQSEIVTAHSDGNSCPMRIDWGDGVVEEKSSQFMDGKVNLNHVYKKKGKMLVSARGIDGCVGVAGEWVTVN